MQQDTLKEILDAEKAIKDMLDAEQQKADTWFKQTKLEIEQATQSELARLKESVMQSEPAARKAAEDKAAEIIQRATSLAERLARIEEEHLKQIVHQHIAAIIPGNDA